MRHSHPLKPAPTQSFTHHISPSSSHFSLSGVLNNIFVLQFMPLHFLFFSILNRAVSLTTTILFLVTQKG